MATSGRILAASGARFDVLILGAGPAGAAAALALKRAGVGSVLLADWPRPQPFRIGESAAPGIGVLLGRLGLESRLDRMGHRPCHGNLSFWGGAGPSAVDFFSRAAGHGWHLNRVAFDSWLRTAAVAAGARLLSPARLIAAARDGKNWRLRLETRSEEVGLSARWVLDATGRAAAASRRLGARLHRLDRLVALARVGEPSVDAGFRGFTMVEAAPYGWWYAADLPDGRTMLALMTDADLARSLALNRPEGFRQAWAATTEIRRFARPAACFDVRPVAFSAATQVLDRTAGPGWLALGDALIACDPLSASGITGALEDALAAADVVLDALDSGSAGRRRLAAGYAFRARATLGNYLAGRQAIYGRERRWAENPFWRRRVAGGEAMGYHRLESKASAA